MPGAPTGLVPNFSFQTFLLTDHPKAGACTHARGMLCHLNCHPHDDEQPTRLRSSDGIAYSSEIFVFWVELESLDIHSHHRNISFLDGGAVGWCQSRTDRQPIRVSNNAQSWRGCYGHQNRMTENEMILPSFPPSCFFQPLCPIPAISLAARATSQEGDAPAPPSPRGHARRNKWGSRPQQLPSLSRRRAQRCRRGPRRLPALLALPM